MRDECWVVKVAAPEAKNSLALVPADGSLERFYLSKGTMDWHRVEALAFERPSKVHLLKILLIRCLVDWGIQCLVPKSKQRKQ